MQDLALYSIQEARKLLGGISRNTSGMRSPLPNAPLTDWRSLRL